MENKLKIYLDLDGVIFNCTKGFTSKFGLELPKQSYLEYDRYDRYWTTENRALLGHDFWKNLELYPWSKGLIRVVEKYDPNFKFLTACIANEGCYSGKYASVKEKLGGKYAEKLITCFKDKTFAAMPNAILIDDKESNCKEWFDSGGIAYLWRQRTDDIIEESNMELLALEGFLKTLVN